MSHTAQGSLELLILLPLLDKCWDNSCVSPYLARSCWPFEIVHLGTIPDRDRLTDVPETGVVVAVAEAGSSLWETVLYLDSIGARGPCELWSFKPGHQGYEEGQSHLRFLSSGSDKGSKVVTSVRCVCRGSGCPWAVGLIPCGCRVGPSLTISAVPVAGLR